MTEESKKTGQTAVIHYCPGHLADGDYAAEGCCCEDGVRCDSCGMHEASSPGGDSFAVDNSRHEGECRPQVNTIQLEKSMHEAVDALYRSSDDVILTVAMVVTARGSFHIASDSKLLDSPEQAVFRDELAEQLKKSLRLLGTAYHPKNLA